MAIRDLFRRKQSPQSAPSRKTSATGLVVAYHSSGRVVWSARDTSSLTKTGYCGNPVGFRAVKLIAEAAAAVPLVLQDADTRYSDHPILRLIRSYGNGSLGQYLATQPRPSEPFLNDPDYAHAIQVVSTVIYTGLRNRNDTKLCVVFVAL